MHEIMKKLRWDHVNLTRLLKLLEQILDEFHAGKEPDFEMMDEMIDYVGHYADLIHHPTEERCFDELELRSDKKRVVIENIRDQHKTLIHMTQSFKQSLEGIMQGAVLLREDVEAQGRDFVKLQRQHLQLEEAEIFPELDAVLNEEDWKRIEADIPDAKDPLFAEPDNSRFRALSQWVKDTRR